MVHCCELLLEGGMAAAMRVTGCAGCWWFLAGMLEGTACK